MTIKLGRVHVPLKMSVKALNRHAQLGCDRDWPATVSKLLAAGVSCLPAEAVADAVAHAAATCDPEWLANALQAAGEDEANRCLA